MGLKCQYKQDFHCREEPLKIEYVIQGKFVETKYPYVGTCPFQPMARTCITNSFDCQLEVFGCQLLKTLNPQIVVEAKMIDFCVFFVMNFNEQGAADGYNEKLHFLLVCAN